MEEKIIQPTFKEKARTIFNKYLLLIKKYRLVFAIALLLPIIALTFLMVQQQQDLRQRAFEVVPIMSRIEINPSGFQTVIGKTINLSTIAYDTNNKPIGSGVTYEWGISSVNSIGTLISISGSVATFIPTSNGHGDIYVTARTSSQTLTYSIPADVGPIIPTSTPVPLNCDVNLDGIINNKDNSVIRQCMNSKRNSTNASCARADLNRDGIVNRADLTVYQTTCINK